MDLKLILIVAVAILAGYFLFFSGRFSENYGAIRPDPAVTEAFEHYRTDPDLVYYYSGSEVRPNAVIGIDRRLVLDSTLWEKMDPTPDPFRGTIRRMQSRALELNRSLCGFAILDPRGDPLGAWYSLPGIHVSVKMLDENRVSISTPPLGVWDEGP